MNDEMFFYSLSLFLFAYIHIEKRTKENSPGKQQHASKTLANNDANFISRQNSDIWLRTKRKKVKFSA